jgi:hypothetical protein
MAYSCEIGYAHGTGHRAIVTKIQGRSKNPPDNLFICKESTWLKWLVSPGTGALRRHPLFLLNSPYGTVIIFCRVPKVPPERVFKKVALKSRIPVFPQLKTAGDKGSVKRSPCISPWYIHCNYNKSAPITELSTLNLTRELADDSDRE